MEGAGWVMVHKGWTDRGRGVERRIWFRGVTRGLKNRGTSNGGESLVPSENFSSIQERKEGRISRNH